MPLINKKLEFSIEGLLLRRSNPDGTPTTPSRILGFSGTVDLSGFGGTTAELVIKTDTVEETKTIDWTAAVDPAAVTVAEMFGFINTAAFTDITASADSTTGRLLIIYSGAESPNFLQVYDGVDLGFAAALDFAQGQTYGGPGVKIVNAYDNVKTVARPKNIKDKQEVETEAGDGTYSSVIIEAITKGEDPVLTFNDSDFNIKQLIMGGVYDEVANSYRPPTTKQTNKPLFVLDIFVTAYDKGANQQEDINAYNWTTLFQCTGNEGDKTNDTKTWADFIFNLSSSEYTDEAGVLQSYMEERNIPREDYNALDVKNL
jgi:hypothetical protein